MSRGGEISGRTDAEVMKAIDQKRLAQAVRSNLGDAGWGFLDVREQRVAFLLLDRRTV